MDKSQIISIIVFVSIILFLLILFLLYVFVWYRIKRNKEILEQQALKQNYNQLLLQSQLEIQEQTFTTISREIHDNVGQLLSLAKVQLNIIDKGDTLNKTLLADAKDSVSKALTDLRDIAKSLSSERIQISGLPEITQHELQRISRVGVMLTHIRIEGTEQNLPEQKKLIIFRVIQEALNNILKHSNATNIDICFCYEAEKLKIDIKDNGIGFSQPLIEKKDGLGLRNILNRAALVGGEAQIKSILNEGTTITIISPYA